jgi:hypothetical protein
MADLNLRNVPEEIIRSLKVDAAAENTTLRELCLRRLVPDGGESWKPQTITGEPITRKEKKPIVTDRAKRQRFVTHVTDVTPVTEEKMITSAKQACDHHAIGDDEPIAREIESAREAEVEEPAVSGGCRKHRGAPGFPKAGGWWCPQCGKIV